MIYFYDFGTKGGTFDWNYIDNISKIESSKRTNENKNSDSKSTDNESNSNENTNSSNKTNDGDDIIRVIKFTCELNDISEYKKLMTRSRQKPKITLDFKNKTTLVLTPLTC